MSRLIWSDSYSNRFGSEMLIGVRQPSFQNYIKLRVGAPNGKIKRELHFPNLVMDAAFDEMGKQGIWGMFSRIAYTCRFGTGSTPPNPLQTDLVSRTGTYVSLFNDPPGATNSGSAPWYNKVIREWTFTPGTVSGNLTEIGFFAGASGIMMSRALILDEDGVPTTLTLLPDEYLYVTYEVRSYVGDLTDQSAEITLNGVDYNINVRKVGVHLPRGIWTPSTRPWVAGMQRQGNSPTQMNATDSSMGGTTLSGVSGTQQPYSPGSLVMATKFNWGPTQGNIAGGINQLWVDERGSTAGEGGFSLFFDKHIPKTSDYSMSLTFETAWGRYVP